MAKKGMKRPEYTPEKKKKSIPVPEINGKAKQSNEKANPVIADTKAPSLKTYHSKPHKEAYDIFDNDLASDNLENHIPEADRQDLH